MKFVTCHVCYAFKMPQRPNAPSANTCHFEGKRIGFQKITPFKNSRHNETGSIGPSTSNDILSGNYFKSNTLNMKWRFVCIEDQRTSQQFFSRVETKPLLHGY